MKSILLVLLLISGLSSMAQEKYFFLDQNNDEQAWQESISSPNFMEINFETGRFSGVFDQKYFSGHWDLQVRSAGFVKGFNYSVVLGYLQRDIPAENSRFQSETNRLARATGFYVYPDVLAAPNWHFIEINSAGFDEKLRLVKSH